MTPAEMAALHRAAFVRDRGWSEREFTDLLASPLVSAFVRPNGFALTRTVAGESELLTVAVSPDHRRQGIARAVLGDWLAALDGTADIAFLEVAADNAAALGLYTDLGFATHARRHAYYARKDGPAVDALLMRRTVTHSHGLVSAPPTPESS